MASILQTGECREVEERGEFLKKLMALDTRQKLDTRQRMGGYEVKTEEEERCGGHKSGSFRCGVKGK